MRAKGFDFPQHKAQPKKEQMSHEHMRNLFVLILLVSGVALIGLVLYYT